MTAISFIMIYQFNLIREQQLQIKNKSEQHFSIGMAYVDCGGSNGIWANRGSLEVYYRDRGVRGEGNMALASPLFVGGVEERNRGPSLYSEIQPNLCCC